MDIKQKHVQSTWPTHLLQVELHSPQKSVEVLSLSTSECDLIWKQGP